MHRTRKLWLVFDGGTVRGKPVRAYLQAPAHGPWLRVTVRDGVEEPGSIHLLVRRGLGDLVVGASYDRAPLDVLLDRLGERDYEIVSIPVVK